MGFMDELKRLTQPYDDDDDDFYEGASEDFSPPPQQSAPAKSTQENASEEFEASFGVPPSDSSPQSAKKVKAAKAAAAKTARRNAVSGAGGSIFGTFGESRKSAPPPQQVLSRQSIRQPQKRRAAPEVQQVILFNPRDFDEAGELVTYVTQGRSLVMALESVPIDTARRLLDFISGICFALNAKITPVSAKTYFITPENVDILDAQALQNRAQDQQEEDY